MADDKPKKKRIVKKSETVRQKREKASQVKPKQRRVRQTVSKANKPAKSVGRFISRIFKPFGFLLRPFKTKPFRAVGRFLYKFLGIGYFINSWKELKQVEWPSRRDTIKLTFAVFVFAIAIAGFVAILDFGLEKVFRQLLI